MKPPLATLLNIGAEPLLANPPDSKGEDRIFIVQTPVGELPIQIRHVGPALAAPQPQAFQGIQFRPPSIFSAPLPTGSGARALGQGSFVGIADDATAASWNPAGLIQLERPETSFAYRFTETENQHASTAENFSVGENTYQSDGLNYVSLASPLPQSWSKRHAVASLNYQEAYDFTHHFTARINEQSRSQFTDANTRTFTATQHDHILFEGGTIEVDINSVFTTRSTSTLRQLIETDIEADLDFEQEGIIEAITPAMAIELIPHFSLGAAVNFYQDSAFPGKNIRSKTTANYTAVTQQ